MIQFNPCQSQFPVYSRLSYFIGCSILSTRPVLSSLWPDVQVNWLHSNPPGTTTPIKYCKPKYTETSLRFYPLYLQVIYQSLFEAMPHEIHMSALLEYWSNIPAVSKIKVWKSQTGHTHKIPRMHTLKSRSFRSTWPRLPCNSNCRCDGHPSESWAHLWNADG